MIYPMQFNMTIIVQPGTKIIKNKPEIYLIQEYLNNANQTGK